MQVEASRQFVKLPLREGYVLGVGASDSLSQQMPVAAHVVCARKAILARAASQVRIDNHRVAHRKPRDVPTHGRYPAGAITARDVWIFQPQPLPALSYRDVDVIQRRDLE